MVGASFFTLLIVSIGILLAVASDIANYPVPGATFDASPYTTWNEAAVKGSRRGVIYAPFRAEDGSDDFVTITRLDLVGDSKTRGFAHGALLAKEIVEFSGPKFDKYIMDQVLNGDLSKYPEPIQKILSVIQVKGKLAAPDAFKRAMGYVWKMEEKYFSQEWKDELRAVAEGLCSAVGSSCNVDEWEIRLQQLNMFPELIRMACTAFGAWSKATSPPNTLIQLRALDLGGGPFSNYTVLAVHRGDPNNNGNAFASVFYPGIIGAITGISQSGIGISEKIWLSSSSEKDMQTGSFQGQADVFTLRYILEFSKTRAEAEQYMLSIPRTWGIWAGVGDYSTMKLDLVAYRQNSSVAYTDVTAPSMTGQPFIDSVAYVDKHAQPSSDPSLPQALTDFYGQINLETTKTIVKYHQTGDQHIASYDFGAKLMYVAVGRINADGEYGPQGGDLDSWKAFNRPYLKFFLEDLWAGL